MSSLNDHLISVAECEILERDFIRTNYKEINRNRPVDKPDSRIYSIDLDILLEYLKMISEEMDKKMISKKGVKFTLGKYPSTSIDPRLSPKYLGYQMMFISPVDLSKPISGKADGMVDSDQVQISAGIGDIPNLNFMNITPPY